MGLPERALPPTPSSPTSATAPKEKKRKITAGFASIVKIPKPSRSATSTTQEYGLYDPTPAGSFPPHHHAYGADPDNEPTLTLDTNLEQMDGIIDMNKAGLNSFVRPLHEGLPGQSATTTTTSTALEGLGWDVLDGVGPSSSLGTSENGGAALGFGAAWTDPFAGGSAIPDPGNVPKSPTSVDPPGYKRPFDPGHGRTVSATVLGKRKSQVPPLDKIRSESKDPAWHAPESWDVDKVGPEAGDYSSDEEMGGPRTGGPKSLDHHGLPHRSDTYTSPGPGADHDGDFGIIEHHRPSSASASTTRPRLKGGNVFNGIGMIGGIGGGAYGIGVPGYGRLRTKSDALSGGGSIGGLDTSGIYGQSLVRKPSWPDGDESISRRPSDALSSSTGPKTPLPSVSHGLMKGHFADVL